LHPVAHCYFTFNLHSYCSEKMGCYGMDSSDSGQGSVTDSCEHRNHLWFPWNAEKFMSTLGCMELVC
jgi:hypothetical protein